MRASLIELVRLRGLQDSTVSLISQAILGTETWIDMDTPREIDVAWAEEFKTLGPAFRNAVAAAREEEFSRLRADGAHTMDLDLATTIAQGHVVSFWGLLRNTLKAIVAPVDRQIQAQQIAQAANEEVQRILAGEMGD